ncbi:hypothetical protein [Nitrosopumilus sp.]|uniref:hypothetical protein n=1 Tax=Nitrosopumilus sp. TaxID=2024843 RepID=UPI00261CB6D2|nr:hypothetical protein [Nitrosopumilus sp.]
MKIIILFPALIFLIPFVTANADSEQILITKSLAMKDIIFDGKWTNLNEWKQSSHNHISYDNEMNFHLRTAHQDGFFYVFIDTIGDKTLDKNSDRATVCIDGKNEKNLIADQNDYCFSVAFGQKQGRIFQGDSIIKLNGNFQRIHNIENFIALSNVSDENDRYSKTPHSSYEFKIPLDLLERSDNYGFYVSVYDSSINAYYSWPTEIHREYNAIPSPKSWGNLISPDKSMAN